MSELWAAQSEIQVCILGLTWSLSDDKQYLGTKNSFINNHTEWIKCQFYNDGLVEWTVRVSFRTSFSSPMHKMPEWAFTHSSSHTLFKTRMGHKVLMHTSLLVKQILIKPLSLVISMQEWGQCHQTCGRRKKKEGRGKWEKTRIDEEKRRGNQVPQDSPH